MAGDYTSNHLTEEQRLALDASRQRQIGRIVIALEQHATRNGYGNDQIAGFVAELNTWSTPKLKKLRESLSAATDLPQLLLTIDAISSADENGETDSKLDEVMSEGLPDETGSLEPEPIAAELVELVASSESVGEKTQSEVSPVDVAAPQPTPAHPAVKPSAGLESSNERIVKAEQVVEKLGELIGQTGSLGALLGLKNSRISPDSASREIRGVLKALPDISTDQTGITREERHRLLQLAGLRLNQKTRDTYNGKDLLEVSALTLAEIKKAVVKGGNNPVEAEQDCLRAILKLFNEYTQE